MRVVAASAAALVGLALLAGCAAPAPSDDPDALTGTVTVLAAASLTDVVEELAARFEVEHPGVDVVLSFGGSAALAEQLVHGAPADVFASANEATMGVVVDEGLADVPAVLATNALALAVPAGNPGGVTGLPDLANPALTVALCDPAVPCGSAAVELLARAGVTASVDTFEEDVRAALTKVAFGEVDAALVYRTDVRAAGGAVEGIEPPEAADVLNRYPIAVLPGGPNPVAARAFVAYVRGPVGREVLADAGFGLP